MTDSAAAGTINLGNTPKTVIAFPYSGDYRIVLTDGSCVNFSRRYRSRLPQLFH